MSKDKRVRINKRMMAWSDGQRVNLVPSLRHEVSDYGHLYNDYHRRLDEGYEVAWSTDEEARRDSTCYEREADLYWEQGKHLYALNLMIHAASLVLPDDEPTYEDVYWLDPNEVPYWHPNVREYCRLMRRCEAMCREVQPLWAVLEAERIYRDYRRYLVRRHEWMEQR